MNFLKMLREAWDQLSQDDGQIYDTAPTLGSPSTYHDGDAVPQQEEKNKEKEADKK